MDDSQSARTGDVASRTSFYSLSATLTMTLKRTQLPLRLLSSHMQQIVDRLKPVASGQVS